MQSDIRVEAGPQRLIVAITGASGTIYGVRLLEMLRETDVASHLVFSRWGIRTLVEETPYSVQDVQQMATHHYAPQDQGAAISSGSFLTLGMAVCPCSMRTLAAIAHGYGDGLIHRAADVVLKERRKLVLVVRETPLNEVHLENMLKLTRMGVVIFPPVPAFYSHPRTIDDVVNQTAMRVLDQFGIHIASRERWSGMTEGPQSATEREFSEPRHRE